MALILFLLLCASSARAQFYEFYAGTYGVQCDDQADDSANLNAGLAAAAASCTYTHGYAEKTTTFVISGRGTTCKVNEPVMFNASCVRLEGNGATLDATGASGLASVLVAMQGPRLGRTAYGNITGGLDNLHINGPGGPSSVCLDVQVSGAHFNNFDLHNCADPIKIDGNSVFLDRFTNFEVSQFTHAGFECPWGFSNTGENMMLSNFTIASSYPNVGVGIMNNGCEINADAFSIDFVNDSAVQNSMAPGSHATTHLSHCHIERAGPNQTPNPVIQWNGSFGDVTTDCRFFDDDGRTLQWLSFMSSRP